MLRRFKTVTIFDIEVESGKSKIVSHYTTQIGEGVKIVKKKDKVATSEKIEEEEF
jgi:hypothetical protein